MDDLSDRTQDMSHFRLLCLFFIIFDDSDHVKGKSRGNDDNRTTLMSKIIDVIVD